MIMAETVDVQSTSYYYEHFMGSGNLWMELY